MSIQDFDIEPVDEWQDFCNVHGEYYGSKDGCQECKDMEAERQHDERKGAR